MMLENLPLVSHSQIGVFNRCEFKYYLRYEQGWKVREKADALKFGTLVHDLGAEYYRGLMENPKLLGVSAPVLQYAQKKFFSSSEYNLQTLNYALQLVKRYIEDFSVLEDRVWTPYKVEEHFVVEFVTPKGRKYELQLYVDLLMIHKSTGKLWLWEHKTVGQGKFWKPIQIMMDNQTPTYQAALRKLGIPVHGIYFNMFNSYQYKNPAPPEKLFRREKSYRTEVEIDNHVLELGGHVDRMIDLRESDDKRRRNQSKDCDWCDFQEPCLLAMKGIPIEDVLTPNYDRSSSYEPSPEFEIGVE